MALSQQAQKTAVYLVNALEKNLIERYITLVDVTTIGSASTEVLPVAGVLDSNAFVCPPLADFMELRSEGLIQLTAGHTSRGNKNWEILLKQDLSDYVSKSDTANSKNVRVFLSYRRIPSAALTRVIALELEKFDIQAFFDTRQIDGAGPFPTRLLNAIEESDILVCLLADITLESDWVIHEIEYAHKLQKPMIPVFQESYRPISNPQNPAIRTLLNNDGIHVFDIKNVYIDAAINDLATMIRKTARSSTLSNMVSGKQLKFRKEYQVPGNAESGINTGLYLEIGDLLEISAAGTVSFDEHDTEADPDGYFYQPKLANSRVQWNYEHARTTRDGSNFIGSLFGWIGTPTKENSFFIGSHYKGAVDERGLLYLCVNDVLGQYGDNQGSFDVRVDVYR